MGVPVGSSCSSSVVLQLASFDDLSANSSESPGEKGSSSSVGPIVGGVMAGVMVLLLVLLGAFLLRRRRKQMQGVDRIHTGALSKEDIFDGPEVVIDPFNSFHYAGVPNSASTASGVHPSSINVSERTPLGPESQSARAQTDSWVYVQNPSGLREQIQTPSSIQQSFVQPHSNPNSKYVSSYL